MAEYDILKTKIQKNSKEFVAMRNQRILEAMAFEGGTFDNRKKHLISSLPNGKESYFFKPGKEAKRKVPNIHDMNPNVGLNEISETDSWAFDKIWEYLIKISIINQITFRKVLVLLYRNCYMLDHVDNGSGSLRYSPSAQLHSYIDKIEFSLKDGFKDKFKTDETGLLEYLHFIDLLGWNEDMKYHIIDSQPDFEEENKLNIGRVNLFFSVARIPMLLNNLLPKLNVDITDINFLLSSILKSYSPESICEIPDKQLLKSISYQLIEDSIPA